MAVPRRGQGELASQPAPGPVPGAPAPDRDLNGVPGRIRVKGDDADADLEANRVEPGSLRHLYPPSADDENRMITARGDVFCVAPRW